MPILDSEIDAQFYEMIHQLSESSDPPLTERRSEQRRAYEALQKIAPYDGRWFPAPNEFVSVHCHDLTRSGFSFLLPNRPAFKAIVACFQGPSETLYVEAEVVRVIRAAVGSGGEVQIVGDGAPMSGMIKAGATPTLLIGCRFVRRLRSE